MLSLTSCPAERLSRDFVASSQEKLEAAKEQWRRGEWGIGLFDLPPDDRSEFIPLP